MRSSKPYFRNLSPVATVVSRIKKHFVINPDTQFLKNNGLNNSLRLNPENRSLICEATFFTCGMHKEAVLIEWEVKIPLAMFAFEIQTFQLYKILLQSNQSDFSPKSHGSFTAIKSTRPTA